MKDAPQPHTNSCTLMWFRMAFCISLLVSIIALSVEMSANKNQQNFNEIMRESNEVRRIAS